MTVCLLTVSLSAPPKRNTPGGFDNPAECQVPASQRCFFFFALFLHYQPSLFFCCTELLLFLLSFLLPLPENIIKKAAHTRQKMKTARVLCAGHKYGSASFVTGGDQAGVNHRGKSVLQTKLAGAYGQKHQSYGRNAIGGMLMGRAHSFPTKCSRDKTE